jgi:hypothetical protein
MGTVIYDKYGINIKRFYGGTERGTCYQITIGSENVQLTENEFSDLVSGKWLVADRLKRYNFIPSDNLKKSDDVEINVSSSTYYKVKEIEFNPNGILNRAKLRIKFDMRAGSGGAIDGQVYKNGTVIGTIQNNGTTSYVTYTEDIGPWEIGDRIQLYAKYVTSQYAYVRNFRVYCDIFEMNYKASW